MQDMEHPDLRTLSREEVLVGVSEEEAALDVEVEWVGVIGFTRQV